MALPNLPREQAQSADTPSSLTPERFAEDSSPVPTLSDGELVSILESYRSEAQLARMSGPTSRDSAWLSHLDLYWNRFDYSKKAPWQAREVLPEFPQYVDRFASALRIALMSGKFYNVRVLNDDEADIAQVVEKVMEVVLARIGRTPTGQRCDFLVTFEEALKYGALMMCSTLVSSQKVNGVNTTTLENVDPYNVWLDPTGRNFYRIRQIEMDVNAFQALKNAKDGRLALEC